ncbi:hypothetical protein MTO96_024384 [Rhipicephalus appendiculatus]
MRGYEVSGATDSTEREQLKDGVRGEVNDGKKAPLERPHECETCAKSFTLKVNLVISPYSHGRKAPLLRHLRSTFYKAVVSRSIGSLIQGRNRTNARHALNRLSVMIISSDIA